WLGTGVARELTEAILEGGPASVWVAEDNPRARRFYEKLGFAPDGATQVEEQLGGIRDLRMVR
ncbi:MAG: GNAT family N-acetyltransferase, partial [Brachybacterium tyrofermentans]